MLGDLFAHADDSDSEEDGPATVTVGSGSARPLELRIAVAEGDQVISGEAGRCLFAGFVWSGSRLLADHLCANPQLVAGRRVVELGCGAAVPGLAAAKLGAERVVLTDFPSDALLGNVRGNVERNLAQDHLERSTAVAGLSWGESLETILRLLAGPAGVGTAGEAAPERAQADLVLASECLWCHTMHHKLLQSIDGLLRPGGKALVTFAHHVPGCEQDDLNFFKVAQSAFGLKSRRLDSREMAQMWTKEKTTQMFLFELVKPFSP